MSGENVVDYYRNGRFEGRSIAGSGNQGLKKLESGKWELDKLSDRTFRLTLMNDDGTRWTGKFKILDQNHIQNIDENYVAERVE
jgi:hypothetical protein